MLELIVRLTLGPVFLAWVLSLVPAAWKACR